MEKLPFMKMNGCGNDFIVIDNRQRVMDKINMHQFIKGVCQRRVSVGADGILMLENSDISDFKMRYFNADGSEGEMCGNGARCIVKFAYLVGAAGPEMQFETSAGIYKAKMNGENVKLKFPEIKIADINLFKKHDFLGNIIEFHYAPIGVPHTVIYNENVENMDYQELCILGEKIRYTFEVFPKGTNVNFVKVIDNKNIVIRTYERGVEDETLSCGTGSTASAVISALLGKVESPVKIHTKVGTLKIYYNLKEEVVDEVYLEGDAKVVVEGFLLSDAWK